MEGREEGRGEERVRFNVCVEKNKSSGHFLSLLLSYKAKGDLKLCSDLSVTPTLLCCSCLGKDSSVPAGSCVSTLIHPQIGRMFMYE